MRKTSIIIISLTSIIFLTGCSCKMGLLGLMTTRKNSFFRDKELNKVHLVGLPSFTYENSYLEFKGPELTGYFNVDATVLNTYAQDVFDYFKSSELTYGAIMDYGYMFGIPNIFDMLKTRDLLKFVQHLNFYKIYGDRYIFFYEVDDQFYELCIRNENNTVNDVDYNFVFKAMKVGQVRWSDDYSEHLVTDENLDSFVTNAEVKYFEQYPDYAEIKLDYYQPEDAHYEYIDVHLLIDYTEFGIAATKPCDTVVKSTFDDCISFRRDNGETYKEGDIELKKVYVAKESAYILKKDNSSNNNDNYNE